MSLKEIVEDYFSDEIISVSSLTGGDINDVYKITTEKKAYVLKVNRKDSFPEMFEKEKWGLQTISETGGSSPKVIKTFDEGEHQYIVLEFIKEDRIVADFWKNFARELVKIHSAGNSFFGLEYDNYIGSLKQINTPKQSWETFFIENRILPLIKQARDLSRIEEVHLKAFERLFNKLNEILPKENPSLVHGDLWSGNIMCGINQTPVFIDPAIYFGNREIDIAMTQMFGGFDRSFMDYYNDIYPLEKNWEERIEIHNLYPSLVHLVLFGKSYLRGIEGVINKF